MMTVNDGIADVDEATGTRFSKPHLDGNRNEKRRRTAVFPDGSLTNRNVLLCVDSLLKFIQDNFCCGRCHKNLHKMANKPEHPLGLEVVGIACGFNFNCGCGAGESLRPRIAPSSRKKITTLEKGKPHAATRVNSGDFKINRRHLLGLQLCGRGRQDAKIIAGLLNLNNNPMAMRHTEIQEDLGKAIIEVAEEVLAENLSIKAHQVMLEKTDVMPWLLLAMLAGTNADPSADATPCLGVQSHLVCEPHCLWASRKCRRLA
jgi:hypothetical protein